MYRGACFILPAPRTAAHATSAHLPLTRSTAAAQHRQRGVQPQELSGAAAASNGGGKRGRRLHAPAPYVYPEGNGPSHTSVPTFGAACSASAHSGAWPWRHNSPRARPLVVYALPFGPSTGGAHTRMLEAASGGTGHPSHYCLKRTLRAPPMAIRTPLPASCHLAPLPSLLPTCLPPQPRQRCPCTPAGGHAPLTPGLAALSRNGPAAAGWRFCQPNNLGPRTCAALTPRARTLPALCARRGRTLALLLACLRAPQWVALL